MSQTQVRVRFCCLFVVVFCALFAPFSQAEEPQLLLPTGLDGSAAMGGHLPAQPADRSNPTEAVGDSGLFTDLPAENIDIGDLIYLQPSSDVFATVHGWPNNRACIVEVEGLRARALTSDDGGQTWSAEIEIAGGSGQPRAFAGHAIQTESGHVYAILTVLDPEGELGIQFLHSDDYCQSWTEPFYLRRGVDLDRLWNEMSAAATENGEVAIVYNDERPLPYVMVSSDYGATWSDPVLGTSGDPGETAATHSELLIYDAAGDLHLFYLQTRSSSYQQLWGTKSSDGGLTFAPAVLVSSGFFISASDSEPTATIASDGTIVVAWDAEYASPENHKLRVAHSTDGGATYTTSYEYDDPADGATTFGSRLSAGPSTVQLFVDAAPGVNLHRSVDNGVSFLAPQLLTPASALSFFPAQTDAGTWALAWLDTRDQDYGGQNDVFANSAFGDIYFRTSTDAGVTWGSEQRANDDPAGGTHKDFNGIAAVGSDHLLVVTSEFRPASGGQGLYVDRSLAATLAFGTDQAVGTDLGQRGPDTYYASVVTADGDGNGYVAFFARTDDLANDLYVAASSDGGYTFSAAVKVGETDSTTHGTDFEAVIDSSYDGSGNYVYLAYSSDNLSSSSRELRFNYSHDGGLTWQPTDLILDSSAGDGFGSGASYFFQAPATGVVAVGKSVYVTWSDNSDVYVARSTDGGANFTIEDVDQDARGWNRYPRICVNPTNSLQVRLVYLSLNRSNNNLRPFVLHSEDGGASWTKAALRPDNLESNGDFPEIACDSAGNAVATWSDTRSGFWDLYASRFNGTTWSAGASFVADGTNHHYVRGGTKFVDTDTVVVAYQNFAGSSYVTRSVDGGLTFGSPVHLDSSVPNPSADSRNPRVGTDGAGQAWISWLDASAGRWAIVARYSSDSGASWEPVRRVARQEGQGAMLDYYDRTGMLDGTGGVGLFAWNGWTDNVNQPGALFGAWDSTDIDRDTILEDDLDGTADACTSGATADCDDNCPANPNADQADGDGDGVGDLCDLCPAIADSGQPDGDGDGAGDACDNPSVVEVVPGDDVAGVPVYAPIRVRFSETVDPLTVGDTDADGTSDTFLLRQGGVLVAGEVGVAADGRSAEFDPEANLGNGLAYEVELTSGITDLGGAPLDPFRSEFQVEASSTPNDIPLSTGGGLSEGDQDNEELGSSMSAAGDLNGDGFADWLVGAPGYDQDGTADRGRVLLYLGSQVESERLEPDVIFIGALANDRLGISVSGGVDVNGDGVPDMVFGAEQHDGTTASGAGRAYLVHFDPADYPNIGDPATPDTVDIAAVADITFDGIATGDRAGHAVALSADMTGDNLGEIAIGAPGADRDTIVDRGEVYLVYGDPTLTTPVDLSVVGGAGVDAIEGVTYLGGESGDGLGWSISAGEDFNGDGIPDIVMGAPFKDVDDGTDVPLPDAGGGYLDTEPNMRGITEVDDLGTGLPGSHDGTRTLGDMASMQLGASVALVSDHDGDALAEVVLGAPGSSPAGKSGAGEVFLISGGALDDVGHGLVSVGSIRDPLTGKGTAYAGKSAGDELGHAVSNGGDTNSDGVAELLMGAPGADAQDPLREDAGASYLEMGTIGTPSRGITEVDGIGKSIPGAVYTGESAGDRSGSALASIGDADGDGNDDFAIGAPQHDAATTTDSGAAYTVTEEPAPIPAESPACGASGCTVSDLGTGAELVVPSGSLNDPVGLAIEGMRDAAPLASPPPAGRMLIAAATITPDRQDFLAPEPTVHLPAATGVDDQLTDGEVFDVFLHDGYSWVDSSRDGTVEANPHFPSRKSIGVVIASARAYAVFAPDQDGDGTRDSIDDDRDGDGVVNASDNCPDTSNANQVDCDSDGTGDLCDPDHVDSDADGLDDACDNCPVDANADQADGDGDGAGDVCDPCPSEAIDDEDGDGFCCPADNCCVVANPSQDDADSDGVGDACDDNPVLRVSSDPADNADHSTIQAAVDGAVQGGTLIEIFPGSSGQYVEQVVLDRNMTLSFRAVLAPADLPGEVIVDGGGGTAFDLVSGNGGEFVFTGLTIEGTTGFNGGQPTRMTDLHFRNITGTALALTGGSHTLDSITMDSSVAQGVDLGSSGSLDLLRSTLEGLTGGAIGSSGSVYLESVLISGGSGAGVTVLAGGSVEIDSSTIADNTGVGLDNTVGGTVSVVGSILWGNSAGDMIAVSCADVSGSDVGSPDCSASNGNISSDPLFDASHGLQAGSPCLDGGRDPLTYTGTPSEDADGDLRLRDYDGNGLCEQDIGAYETTNVSLSPGAVSGIIWSDAVTLGWDAEPSAALYHVYRGDPEALAYTYYGDCRDDLDANQTDTQLSVPDDPLAGTGWFFIITAEGGGGEEGTLGNGSYAERSNYSACP